MKEFFFVLIIAICLLIVDWRMTEFYNKIISNQMLIISQINGINSNLTNLDINYKVIVKEKK